MITFAAALLLGLVVLTWSADRFVYGASAVASQLGVQPLVVGMVIVGFGTSAPELLVSASAALKGNAGIAVGNAIGSNIANIALILGITALIQPIRVKSKVVRQEIPLLLGVSLLLVLLLYDQRLGRIDGTILISGLIALLLFTLWEARRNPGDALSTEFQEELPASTGMGRALLWTLVGMVLLIGSAQLLVWGAVGLARLLGIGDLVIGLTIVAIGTSLPELASSIAAARKGEPDIAIGNVVGSNLFNSLGVLALPGLLAPTVLEPSVLWRDLSIMVALTIMLLPIAWGKRGHGRINRLEGALLLGCFVAYQGLLYTYAR